MTYNEKFKWHKSTSNISIKAQMCSNTYAAHFSKHERWSAKCAENNVHHNMRGTNGGFINLPVHILLLYFVAVVMHQVCCVLQRDNLYKAS